MHLLFVAQILAVVQRMDHYRLDTHHGGYLKRTQHARLGYLLAHGGIVPAEGEGSVRLVENYAVGIGKPALRLNIFAPPLGDIGGIVAGH